MKKLLLALLTTFYFLNSFATEGDTTWVITNEAHLDWYGRKDQQVVFPNNSTSFQRIMMFATIGCPTGGCSGWDYTTKLELRHNTGEIDSNQINLNSFQVDGSNYDSIGVNFDTTYTYFFNGGITDSSANSPIQIVNFGVSQNSSFAIDTTYFWPSSYWNYIFDGTGTIIDSVFVSADSTGYANQLSYYNLFDVIENYELARIITPYGSYYDNTWKHTWLFDVSDFEPLLHDTTTLSSFYGGWQDGFTMQLDFAFIEGTPSREVISIENIYSSGMGGFLYGEAGNPDVIEESLIPISTNIDVNAASTKLRVTHSGHSFGGSENCAEFCPKNYYVKIGAFTEFTQSVWRDDCGLNPLFHQSGTWIYDRANWCPGEVCITREHDLTNFVSAGSTLNLDIDMDTYNYVQGPSQGFDPMYIIESQLVQYGSYNYTVDASMERIVSPNNDSYFNRYNPTCGSPVVRIKNNGTTVLTSATITYGAKDAEKLTYNWTGNLAFGDETDVTLPVDQWTNWAEADLSGIFEASISNPNGVTDGNTSNNTQYSNYELPPVWDNDFYIWFVTNNAASESSYRIEDESGNIVFENTSLSNSTTYKDTMDLSPGCYKLVVEDTDCDGLSFSFNSDGSGMCRIMKNDGAFTIIKNMEADFGCENSQWFTVGYSVNQNELYNSKTELQLFPNPSSGLINVGAIVSAPGKTSIEVRNAMGSLVTNQTFSNTGNFNTTLNLENEANGIYFITLQTESESITKRIVLSK